MNFKIPEDIGAKKRTRYWNVSVILGVFALILFFIGVNRAKGAELIACGWGSCCFSLVYAFSALRAKSRLFFIEDGSACPVPAKSKAVP